MVALLHFNQTAETPQPISKYCIAAGLRKESVA
jgi:hypothetical protein